MNRRLFIILIAIIVILGIVALLVTFAANKRNAEPEPVKTNLKITKILDETAMSPVASLDSTAIWYFNSQGKLFSIKNDGTGISEFPLPIASIKYALWPKEGSDFIGVTDQRGYTYYKSSEKIYLNLPSNIQYLGWMPDSKRVVYVWLSDDKKSQSLVMADADGTGFQKIIDLFWSDLAVEVSPDGKNALLWRRDIQEINKIYKVNLETKEIATLVEEGRNVAAKWISPTKFIFAQANKTFLFDLTTNKSTDLANTSINKVTTNTEGTVLYAAVPKSDNSGDNFVKMDLSSLKQENYFQPTEKIEASNLFLVGNSVYFTGSRDQKLYKLGL